LRIGLRIQNLILATDMARHSDYMSALSALLEAGEGEGFDNCQDVAGGGSGGSSRLRDGECAKPRTPLSRGPHRELVSELLLKCADTSNIVRPFPIARRWAV
jgi:hypothetical protein